MFQAHLNGYVPELPHQQVLENQIHAYEGFIADNPSNGYWRSRLEEARAELDAIFVEQNPGECECSPVQEVACPYCMSLDAEEVF